MKKLVLIAAVALSTVCAKAASVNWMANAIQSSPDVSVAAGWLIQIYTSSVTYDYAAAKDGTITAWASGATVAAGTTFRATGKVTDGQTNGTTVNYYAVVYDASTVAAAKNYIVSDAVSVVANAAGSDASLSFGAMSGANLAANKFYNSTWTAVPEPTSGLLMLLGMAGLALRRRRA